MNWWLMNFRPPNLKGSVGLILPKTSVMRISIPLDFHLSLLYHCLVTFVLVVPIPFLTPSLVLFPHQVRHPPSHSPWWCESHSAAHVGCLFSGFTGVSVPQSYRDILPFFVEELNVTLIFD